MKKKIIITSIAIIATLAISITAAAAISNISLYRIEEREAEERAKLDKTELTTSDYGMYDDRSNGKKEINRTFQFDSKQHTARYEYSDNFEDLPINKRSDSYGTYDIYIDENNIEFKFLYNSDILCGMYVPAYDFGI